MIYLYLAFVSLLASAGPRSIASLDPAVNTSYIDCIKSLKAPPTTPSFPNQYFQRLEGVETFTLRCHKFPDSEEFMRIAFQQSEKMLHLKLPIYYYKIKYADGSSQSTDLPRNIVHFKYLSHDQFFELEFVDVINLLKPETVPAIAKKLMVSMSQVQNEYVKKYEAFLKTKGLERAIIPVELSLEEQTEYAGCFEDKKQEIVEAYISGKYRALTPAYSTIFDDTDNRDKLSEETKNKYKKKWEEFEIEAAGDIEKNHPACEGIVSTDSGSRAFTKAFQSRKAPYEALHNYLFE